MHAEQDFLRKLLDRPADDTALLVYADWLDEQGGAGSKAKAGFIRFELEAAERLATLPEGDPSRVAIINRLRDLARDLDPGWLAVVSRPVLEACRFRLEFECPMQWERLTTTDDAKVRFCESCRQNVHYCDTIEEAREHAWKGGCVAVALPLVRHPLDLKPRLMVGSAGIV